jgi:hypothetical protein
VRERSPDEHLRLPHCHARVRDARQRRRLLGQCDRHVLEVVERLHGDTVGRERVQTPVVEHTGGGIVAGDGEVDLQRLGMLALVRQDADSHVKAHADERDHHGPLTERS